MARRCLAAVFGTVGFLSSLAFPIWAAASQMAILRAQCGDSLIERMGVTVSGAILIAFVVGLTVWRYVSARLREVLRPQRTLFGFFAVGYALILAVRTMISSLEVLFLGGLVGASVAVICYAVADRLREGARA